MPHGVALVTGAASGLGAAIAADLAAHGWRVTGLDLRASATEVPLEADVTDVGAVRDAVARAERELGPLTDVVTAAGIYAIMPTEDMDDEQWQRMLRVNLLGTATVLGAVLPGMVERGRGAVVTISSDLGVGGSEGDAHYAATKGAIVGLTRALSVELRDAGITVGSVAPGAADTAMLAEDSPWRAESFLSTLPVQRLVRADEIAAATRFLLEHGAGFPGVVLSPNSGATI